MDLWNLEEKTQKNCKIAFLVCTTLKTVRIKCEKEEQIINVFQGIFAHNSIDYQLIFS